MDKYQKALELTEHPERFSGREIWILLDDKEIRDIYNLICLADSSYRDAGPIDIEREWGIFERKVKPLGRDKSYQFGSRVAAIAAIILSSIVAVATGIVISVSVAERKQAGTVSDGNEQDILSVASVGSDNAAAADTAAIISGPILFEDNSLGEILGYVAESYDMRIEFRNQSAETLRLYYRLDPSLSIDIIISQLNNFEQINITRNENIITVF